MLTIDWSDTARKRLRDILSYCNYEFGETSALDLYDSFMSSAEKIARNSLIGYIEPSVKDCSTQFRYLIVKKYNKLVYYVKEDTVHIVEILDTRMNPKTLDTKIKTQIQKL